MWSAATRRSTPDAKTLMTGSHYDTVRDGGKYDGRLGILLPIAIVRHLHARGERLPFHLEVDRLRRRRRRALQEHFPGQ